MTDFLPPGKQLKAKDTEATGNYYVISFFQKSITFGTSTHNK